MTIIILVIRHNHDVIMTRLTPSSRGSCRGSSVRSPATSQLGLAAVRFVAMEPPDLNADSSAVFRAELAVRRVFPRFSRIDELSIMTHGPVSAARHHPVVTFWSR